MKHKFMYVFNHRRVLKTDLEMELMRYTNRISSEAHKEVSVINIINMFSYIHQGGVSFALCIVAWVSCMVQHTA